MEEIKNENITTNIYTPDATSNRYVHDAAPSRYTPNTAAQTHHQAEQQELKDWEKYIPLGNRELLFGLFYLLCGFVLVNSGINGGLNLGFAAAMLGFVIVSVIYLSACGYKGNWYSNAVLVLCLIIIPGFARSDDSLVKNVMLCFLFIGINLSLTVMAGKNQWNTASVHSLLDPFHTFFSLGFGEMPKTTRGLKKALQGGGIAVKSGANVVLGLLIAIPIVIVMVFLLMSADAAFEGLIDLLPEFEMMEMVVTVSLGGFAAVWLFSRTVLLNFHEKTEQKVIRENRSLSSITMNTVLGAVCMVYLVYLFSQLAYFFGGFAGVLPEGYSLAQYARRGFFEMTWLCMINLSVIIFAISKTRKNEGRTPFASRILCFIIGVVTLFLVITAGAKMMMYIGDYGMSRLRVLTMVIMVFLGITTALVSVWLFIPKLPYMRIVILTALVMGAAVFWIDVDTQVARYNVNSYLTGRHEEIDMNYLSRLGSGSIPYIDKLADEATDPEVVVIANDILKYHYTEDYDLRGWNYADHVETRYRR